MAIRDQVALVSRITDVRAAAVMVMDRLDHVPPGTQLVGIAVALNVLCEAAGVETRTVLQTADNILRDTERYSTDINALRLYAKGELQ